jgi:LysR family hydrogen peroxide-inducible transcriptional activator
MNLRVFEYLLALEKHGSFRLAAEECSVSQPALSIQIRRTEEELGVDLLERSPRGFIFTESGQEVLKRARIILQQVADVEALAEVWDDPYSGTLALGAFPTLAPYYFPEIIDHLVDAYPNLRINLIEEKTQVLFNRLHAGTLDAAFLAFPVDSELLEHGQIFTEEFFVGVSTKHLWAGRKTIRTSQLAAEPLLLLEEGHCLRGQALDFCSHAGLGEVLNFRASSMQTLLQMVSMGRAISLIPRCVARQNPQIHCLKIRGGGPERTIGLFWRKSSVRSELMLELVDDLSREYTG